MSIKLILLKTGETVISDAKEVVSMDSESGERSVHAYLLKNPNKVNIQQPFLVSEGESLDTIQISLSPWIILTSDDEIQVYPDWVVTIVEPIDSLKEMYEEKVNGKNDKVSFTEE